MSIDMPPEIPPALADSPVMQAFVTRANHLYIEQRVGTFRVMVAGNRYLSEDEVEQVLAAADTPSQAIRNLNRLYHRHGHLLVRLFYLQQGDTVYVHVFQSRLEDIKAPTGIRAHFSELIGDPDLTVSEFDRHRVLADMKSTRAGVDYAIEYEPGDSPYTMRMIFTPEPIENHESTDLYLDAGNQGNRFVGRYFAGAGIVHRFHAGSEVSLKGETALVDLGETQGGEHYAGGVFNFNHPSRIGLYGMELIHSAYERSVTLLEPRSVSPLDTVLPSDCLDPDETICLPPLDEPVSTMQSEATILSINAKTSVGALTGEQVLYSSPHSRMTFSQRLEWVEDEIDSQERGILIDEAYGSVQLGLKYLQNGSWFGSPVRFLLQVFGKGGVTDDRGTFSTVDDPGFVGPGKRSAQYLLMRPKLGLKLNFGPYLRLSLDATAQISNDKQVPLQQQFVLGGMDLLSAYLPGVLIGDTGAYARASFEGINLGGENIRITPSIFAEYGGVRFEDVSGVHDEIRSVADAGARLSVRFGAGFDMELVAAESISDKNIDPVVLQQSEADFFWRVRMTF